MNEEYRIIKTFWLKIYIYLSIYTKIEQMERISKDEKERDDLEQVY